MNSNEGGIFSLLKQTKLSSVVPLKNLNHSLKKCYRLSKIFNEIAGVAIFTYNANTQYWQI